MKKWAKLLCCVLMMGFALTTCLAGCATVSNIHNSSEELIYNGNSAVRVDGYLYYGNAYADYSSFSTVSDYRTSARVSYLARLDTNAYEATSGDYSPTEVDKVANEVAGHGNDFMFVLGQYIYYATPNTQKATDADGATAQYFNYTTIYRSGLNGNGKTRIYTTNGEVSEMEVLKAGDTYYLVIFAGDTLVKIDLSNNNAEEIVTGVSSVAMPETYQKDKLGSSLNFNGYIYYTTAREETSSGLTGNVVYRVALSGGEAERVYGANTDITLVDRKRDVVFYSETRSGTAEIYTADVSDTSSTLNPFSTKTRFVSASSITNLNTVSRSSENELGFRDLGYVYTANEALRYSTLDGTKSGAITLQSEGSEITSYAVLLVSGQTMFVSTSTGIYRVDLSQAFNGNGGNVTIDCATVVTMTAIQNSGLYAYDGKYIYFYAQLETVEEDKDSSEEETDEETHENYYLYRANASTLDGNYQLLGLTNIESRHTTEE